MMKALTLSTVLTVLAIPAFAGSKTYDFQGFKAIQAQDSVHVIVTAGQEFSIRTITQNSR